MKTIAFVGQVFHENALELQNKGYHVITLLDKDEAKAEDSNELPTYLIDFTDEETIKTSLEKLDFKIDALLSTYERYIVPRAILGKILNLNVPSIESAKAVTDKFEQRKLYIEHYPEITPKFKLVDSIEDLEEFLKDVNFPVILKPTNLTKSLFVSKCNNFDDLKKAFLENKSQLQEIYKREKMNREPKLIVEEFLVGSAHSIEVFSDSNGEIFSPGKVVDVTKANELGIDDNYEYVRVTPSRLKDEQQKEVLEVATKGMKALGLTNCPGHAEIMYTQNGPKIIEINGRVGGYRDRMYRMSYGIELIESEIKIYCDEALDMEPKKNYHTAVFEIFPDKPGIFERIENFDEMQALKSLKYFSQKRKFGEAIGLSKGGFKCTLVVILNTEDKQQFDSDFDFIKSKVKIIVQ